VALRIPFAQFLDESEDLQRRNFTTLHRILFGLSETTLDTYLKLSTAEIDIPCSLGRTPLCWAALRKDFLPVQTLVKFGAALHLRDWRGQSPFHFAAETGAFESLKILLDAAASKGCVPQNQVTIDQNTTVSEFCLSLIEARDSKGRTPLHFSTRVNFVAHANILLRYGADINSADNVQRTPLLVAIYWNHHDMLELLLARGARTDVLDINRMTVLHYAAKFGDWKTLEALRREGIGGISADMRDSAGYTPMETFDQLRSIFIAEDPDTLTRSRLIMEALLVDNTDVESEFTDDELFFDALASLEASVSSLDGLTNGVNDLLSVTEVAP
jgi:ankyrin repeat protein